MAADWLKIKNEYTSGHISYRKLAEKHSVSIYTLTQRAMNDKWVEQRERQHNKIAAKIQQKTAEVIANREAGRIGRILAAADMLLARVEEATGQLDTHIVTNKVKTKKVTYNGSNKAIEEVTTENETKATALGPVDRQGLQQVAAALKSIKDTIQTMGDGKDVPDNNLFEAIERATGTGVETDAIPELQRAAEADTDVVE